MDVQESLDRAAALQADQDDRERDAARDQEHESFDEFWAEIKATEKPRYESILGVRVRVPTTMTLRFRQQLDGLDMQHTDEAQVREVLADLFGVGTLDAWVDAGMDDEQLAVVMAWAIASASGREITWREAYEAVRRGKAERAAKAKALAAKTGTSSTPRSGGTGGRSRGGRSRKGSRRRH